MSKQEHEEKNTKTTTEQENDGADSDESTAKSNGDVQKQEEKTTSQERDEYLEGWKRAQADLQNLKKRHEEERSLFVSVGKESLLRDLVPMLDNFEAAFSNRDVWESVDKNWRIGIEYIYNQFKETLINNGIRQVGEVGETFDANIHESIEAQDEGNSVIEVRQKGYVMGEKVIRPAKVVIGVQKES